jgi:protein SCO1/2
MLMLSISLDPENDSPSVLKQYAAEHRTKPGWLFLTGDPEDLKKLRWSMGVRDLDPAIDADFTQHGNLLTFGNDRTGRWMSVPALVQPKQIVASVLVQTHEWGQARRRATSP